MRAAQLNPELRSLRFLPSLTVQGRLGRAITRTALRLYRPPAPPPAITLEVTRLAGPGTGVRVYTPAEPTGAALLWIHGGGMVIGTAAQDDARCAALAADLGITVVSAEYRLAPEHPYPAPLDDCAAAWEWLHASAADRGIDPARVAIGGQSAGGGLAAGLALRLHDEGGPRPAAQWLFCPMLDDRTAADRARDGIRYPVWDNKANRAGWAAYLGAPPGSPGIPAWAAPARRTSYTGLPPAWIGAGTIELFYDEDRAYAASLTEAGVDATFDPVAGAPHAFEAMARNAPVTQAYIGRASSWLRDQLSGCVPTG